MKRQPTPTRIIQLHLWDSLQIAAETPEIADLTQLWQTLDAALQPLSLTQQLQMAGDAVAQIAQIVQDRSLLTLEELASAGQTEGPIMPPDAFDRFVRQSMRVDFEPFVAVPDRPAGLTDRQPESADLAPSSIAVEVDAAQLLANLPPEISFENPALDFSALEPGLSTADFSTADLSTSYSEAALTWADEITSYCEQVPLPIGWPQLRQALPLAAIELWLGLLLGEFELCRSAPPLPRSVPVIPGRNRQFATIANFEALCTWFYSDDIWVKPLLCPDRPHP
jgi:uncharacterized protein Usg